MSEKKNIIRQTAIYTITDGICKALSFLTIPLISYYIAPEQLGIAANFSVLQNILTLLAGQVIVNALPYFYYGRAKESVALLVSNLLVVIICLNIICSLAILIAYPFIENYLQIGLYLQLLAVVCSLTQVFGDINTLLYRLEEKPSSFSKLKIAQTILCLGALIFFVINLKLEAIGKIYSIVISYSIMFAVHFYLLLRRGYLVLKIDTAHIKELVYFGIPLLPHSLSFWMKSGMDKILLTTYCGLAANGLYSMAMSFGAAYSIFNTAFNNAYVPHLQKKINNMTNGSYEKKELVITSYKIGLGFIGLYFIIVLICWLAINYILDEKYKEAFEFIPWIILSLTFNAFYGIVIQFPYTVKKTVGLSIITFSGSLIQLFLTYILIKHLGTNGIKYSLAIGSLLIAVGVWWYSNKVYPLPWFTFLKKT